MKTGTKQIMKTFFIGWKIRDWEFVKNCGDQPNSCLKIDISPKQFIWCAILKFLEILWFPFEEIWKCRTLVKHIIPPNFYSGVCKQFNYSTTHGVYIKYEINKELICNNFKVRTFWEAHIIWKNLPHGCDIS